MVQKKTVEGKSYALSFSQRKDSGATAHSEEISKQFSWKPLFFIAFLLLTLAGLFFAKDSIVGYIFLEPENTVKFAIQPEWNLSNGLVRISQNEAVYDETNLSALVEENDIVVYLDHYNLSTGYVYVDLIIDDTLVDSEYVYYTKKATSPELALAPIENLTTNTTFDSEPVVVAQEESASTTAYSGWFQGNSTGTLQVDHVIVEPKIPYINNTLNCSNGSVSTDVSSLLYLWYVNETSLRYDNRSTLGTGNFTVHDQIDCAIAPQNDTNLLAYWAFDEGRGSLIYDIVNNNSGNFTNANWARGRDFYAVNISGTQNITILPNAYALNASRAFTHEMWVMPKSNGNGDIFRLDYLRIYFASGGFVKVDFPTGAGASEQKINSTGAAPTNVWTHVAVTYNNSLLSLYFNGVLDNATRITGNVPAYTGNVTFGQGYDTNLVTYLDKYVIYNKSLTQEEVIEHFRNGVVKHSRRHTTEVDTTQDHFLNGTLTNVEGNGQAGNITISGNNVTGNFTSRVIDLPNGHNDAVVKWSNVTLAGHNLSVKVRSGVASSHGGINWSEFSGPDPTHSRDSSMILGLDFSKKTENTTTDIASGQVIGWNNNDIVPTGKHGFGIQIYGIGGLPVADSTQLRLASPQNYTIELWVNPLNTNNHIIFNKNGDYFLYFNASGNVVFNATYESNQTTISSISTLPTNTWTHIAIAHDADNRTLLFINGSNEATQTANGTINSSTGVLSIGTSPGFSNYNGTIDSFAIYNRTFAHKEVSWHAEDIFVNSTGGAYAGDLNRFIQYRVFFERNEISATSTFLDFSVKVANYSTFIYNHNPRNTSLDAPLNNTVVTTAQNFNWTTATDLENDTLMYEFVIANESDFSPVVISRLAVNNFSEFSLFDDNYTTFVEHFNKRSEILGHGLFVGNWTNALQQGKWGNGIVLSEDGMSLSIPIPQATAVLNKKAGSIEFWVKPRWSPSDGSTNYFLDEDNSLLTMHRTGSLLTADMGNSQYVLTYNISSWSANEWHHVAVSWQESRNFTLFIDGARVNRTTITSSIAAFNNFYIGSTTGGGFILGAVVDSFRISNVSRESYLDINMTNLTINPGDFADNTYYWRVRVLNYNGNNTFEGERLDSSWDSRAVRLDTRTPAITVTERLRTTYWNVNADINISSDEPVYCEIRSPTTSFVPMNFPNGLQHDHRVNITTIGNYTYLINCNDTTNTFVNTTFIFYAFNQSEGNYRQNVTNFTFLTNQSTLANFTRSDGTSFAKVNFSTKNNMTGKVAVITHDPDNNPENSTDGNGFAGPKVRFITFIVDEFLTRNFSDGNATISLLYDNANFSTWESGSAHLYYFFYGNSTWVKLPYLVNMSADVREVSFETNYFSTYVIVGATKLATKKTTTAAEGGLTKQSQRKQTAFTKNNFQQKDISQEMYVDLIKAGEQKFIDVFNPAIGILDMVIVSNQDLKNVVFYVQKETPVDPNKGLRSFSISAAYFGGESVDPLVIDSFVVSYAVSKEKLLAAGYDVTNLVLTDTKGNAYVLEYLDEDDDFYYVESAVNSFGTFALALGNIEAEEEVVAEETKEEKAPAPEEEKPGAGQIFVYTAVSGLAVLYLSRFALAALFLFRRDYDLTYEDLEAQDEDITELKYYLYQNIGKENLEDDLRKKGIDPVVSSDLIARVQKLGRGKMEQYVYQALSRRRDTEAIVQELVEVGWDETIVRKIIEQFQKI